MRRSEFSLGILLMQGIGLLWILFSGYWGMALLGYGFAWGGSVPFHVQALGCAVPLVALFALLVIPGYLRSKSEMSGCAVSIFLILGTLGTQAICYIISFYLSIL